VDVLRDLVPADVGTAEARVAVLSGPGGPPTDLLAALPLGSPAATLDADLGPDRLHALLAALAPLDLLVDAGGQGGPDRLAALLGHVRVGGAYAWLLDDADSVAAWVESLADLRASLVSDASGLPPRKAKKRRDLATLALATQPTIRDGVLVAVNEAAMLAKLHDPVVDEVLRERGGPDRVVTSLPAATWASRAEVRVSRRPPLNDLPTTYDAPALSLREYHRAVCLPRQAAYTETFVTPESFRDNLQPRLQNPALEDWTARFVRRPAEPFDELAGSWFHLDTHVAAHFGHAVTEQVAHLWGWAEAKRRDPGLRALVFAPPETPGAALPGWARDLLEAGGVSAADVHVAAAPVRVERLLAATSAYNIGRYAHPVMAETWGRIGANLSGEGSGPARVFLTRSGQKRVCRNREAVESFFADAGFTVVSPERLRLADQVALVRGASVVAGFAGSAMFHTAFAARPQHVVAITTETYPAHNEHAIAALLGHRLDLVVCPPDVARRDPDQFTSESFHSDYVVDLDGVEGDFLRAILPAA